MFKSETRMPWLRCEDGTWINLSRADFLDIRYGTFEVRACYGGNCWCSIREFHTKEDAQEALDRIMGYVKE